MPNVTDPSPIGELQPRKEGCRPNGTTTKKQNLKNKAIICLKNEITQIYITEQEKERENNRRVSNNFLDNVIKETKNKHNLDNIYVNRKTIKDRVLKRRRIVLHQGHASPMISIEDTLITLMNKMSSICQPLNCTTGLELTRSLVKGSPIEDEVRE